MKKVVIAGGARIPFCRAGSSYASSSNQELITAALQALVKKFGLEGKAVGDVALGGVMNHASDWNMAREAVLGSGLAPETPAFGLQRACGTSLEATILVANKIALGQIECGVAAGVDTTSDAPIALNAIAHGKHVLCEKPLALNHADARAMADAAERDRHVRHPEAAQGLAGS